MMISAIGLASEPVVIELEYKVRLPTVLDEIIGGQKRAKNDVLWILDLKTRGPSGLGLGLRSSSLS